MKKDKYKWYNYLMSKSISELRDLLKSFNNQLELGINKRNAIEQINKIEIVMTDKFKYNLME